MKLQSKTTKQQIGESSKDSYNPYRMLKSQIEYFSPKDRLGREPERFMAKSQKTMTFTIPPRKLGHGTDVINGHAIS